MVHICNYYRLVYWMEQYLMCKYVYINHSQNMLYTAVYHPDSHNYYLSSKISTLPSQLVHLSVNAVCYIIQTITSIVCPVTAQHYQLNSYLNKYHYEYA